MSLVLIEGLPGTGKSTLAQGLCSLLHDSGIEAAWYREEAADHPVHPTALTQRRCEPDFAERCLQAWRRFVDSIETRDGFHVLEGSAFQSTVRFLMEQEHVGIDAYVQRFAEIVAPLSPCLVYLRPDDALAYSRGTAAHRGADWSGKVASYLQATPCLVARNWSGTTGMHAFWSDYAQRCDLLVEKLGMPTLTIVAAPADQKAQLTSSIAFLRAFNGVASG